MERIAKSESKDAGKIRAKVQPPNFEKDVKPDNVNGFILQRSAACACGGDCPTCQTKGADLQISHPTDASEIEADRVAEKVMRMSADESLPPEQVQTGIKSPVTSVSPVVQTKREDDFAVSDISSRIAASRGSSLDSKTQSFMQSRFGADFSDVKIHTDSNAVKLSRELNAHAFTVGNDVFFNEGKYSPETSSGKHLLAHELTHTLQQGKKSNSGKKAIQRTAIPVPVPAPIVIPFAAIALILAVIALIALGIYVAYQYVMSKIAEIITAIETVSAAIEEYIRNNPREGMRCSAELIAFRLARDAALEALRDPARFGMIIIIRRFEAFKDAVNALAACLGLPPIF